MLKGNVLCLGLLSLMLTWTSCGNNTKQSAETSQQKVCADTQSQANDVDAVLAQADLNVGKEITVEGVCTHICKHGGRKIFLMGSDDTKTIRVEGGKMGKFDAACVNNMVRVKGVLCEQRIDEAYLQQWESQVANQTAEQHGDSEAGCDTEKKARNEKGNSPEERIADFRARIAQREAESGKAYLSFYYVEALEYEIVK